MPPLKVAVVGCGNIAGAYGEAMQRYGRELRVLGASDLDAARAKDWAGKYGGRPYASLDAVLASACLPHLFQAVEIDGRSYWDGGFTANPPIAPLGSYAGTARTLLILVNPTRRAGVPRTARDIASRLNQIAGNASLLRDLAALGPCDVIEPPEASRDYAVASKYNNDWAFIQHLHALGRREAERLLA